MLPSQPHAECGKALLQEIGYEDRHQRWNWPHRIKDSREITQCRARGGSRSPQSGLNSVTGEGVAETVKGAQVIVDLSNSPSWEDAAVLEFFQKSTGNLVAAAKANGVKHYIALSVVGTERLQASGYFGPSWHRKN